MISYYRIFIKLVDKNDAQQNLKPQLHCHDFGHDGATTHPDLSSRDASA